MNYPGIAPERCDIETVADRLSFTLGDGLRQDQTLDSGWTTESKPDTRA